MAAHLSVAAVAAVAAVRCVAARLLLRGAAWRAFFFALSAQLFCYSARQHET